jgi:hypothetical protein
VGALSFFSVDQGVRWFDGSLLRGSLFGTDAQNRLIRFSVHDNDSWQWDTPVPLPQPPAPAAPIGIASRVSCAVMTDASGWHLTALMRDINGTIWNREYEIGTSAWRQSWQ